MKNIKLSEFEIYLLQESLKHYQTLIAKEDFSKNSIVTKCSYRLKTGLVKQLV